MTQDKDSYLAFERMPDRGIRGKAACRKLGCRKASELDRAICVLAAEQNPRPLVALNENAPMLNTLAATAGIAAVSTLGGFAIAQATQAPVIHAREEPG